MYTVRKKAIYAILFLSPLVFIFLSLFIGRYHVPLPAIIEILWSKLTLGYCNLPDTYVSIVWDIRLPRAILGALVGGCLAISGASFQGLFRNPLVSSGILGVSSGAGFGAALAILIFSTTSYIYIFAFCFGGLAVLMSYMIGRVYNTTPAIMLVLGGVIVSSVFSALISFAKYVADPYDQLPAIVFWLMGSLASARFQDIAVAGIPMAVGIAGLFAIRWRINVLSMGDKEARSLGINTALSKGIVIFCATLATAGAVCVSGIIGWVGLVIPHIGRMLVGNDNRVLIPASLSLGACFMLLVDNMGRVITGSEIPLGILTAIVGGPFFVYLLKKTKGGGW
ncbi:FecCD family ABC transporter permease [Pelotomaculum propionicicum]|uniref:FecCD family ABC transporter permease n=1 Tax=Pelotomaculum propionicicum TaxID=258475 RepID=UPI003B7E1B26